MLHRATGGGHERVLDDMGRLIHSMSTESLIPCGQMTREDAYEIAQSAFRLVGRGTSRHSLIGAGDYAVKIERFHESGRIAELVDGWHRLQVCDPYAACGLRVFPYADLSDLSGTGDPTGFLAVHLVNYNVDITKPVGSAGRSRWRTSSFDCTCPTAGRPRPRSGSNRARNRARSPFPASAAARRCLWSG